MENRPRPLPTGLTAVVVYLVVAGILSGFLFGATAVGVPTVVATYGVAVLIVGFPLSVLIAVAVRPAWLKSLREATLAIFRSDLSTDSR